ncbi:GH92 family glycosyl hydrolase [Luteimonas abyssi]|uniref:GH92 family glycosyl hydrolase n=1 Tax=Luteimonas abyssi TaxID=1247514 RepID=UPI0009E9A09E|nr:GH92 family glycosyl hydrolase [Luteimonas abyssi]
MTDSSFRRRLLRASLATALAWPLAALSGGFATSFEVGDPRMLETGDGALSLRIGTGPEAPYAARAGAGYSGTQALRYDASAAGTRRLFDVATPVDADTELSWMVLPEIVDGDVEASTWVSLDLVFDDGSRLSATDARDHHGIALGARAQGESKTLYPQQWARKAVRLGDVSTLVGRRVVAIELEVRPPEGRTARGWIDDIALADVPRSAATSPSDHVLTTRGTQSNARFSRGNNLPATAVPHGFNFWAPVTDAGVLNWLYRWNEHNDDANRPRLQALALSHQTSPWMGDRQTFQVMPSVSRGIPDADREQRALSFDRAHETARPHLYRVRFDNGIDAALAPTDRAAVFEFAFPADGDANLLFDNVDARGGLTLDPATQTLTGYTDVRSGLSTGATRMFVVARFDTPWRESGTIDSGRPTGYVKFAPSASRTVRMHIATSLISVEQAWRNLDQELGAADTVADVAERARVRWDALLGRFDVDGARDDQRVTLYSNLYRLFLYPNAAYENAGSAEAPDWRYASQMSSADDNAEGNDQRTFAPVRDGRIVVNNGLWDTFRTAWPAYSLFGADNAGTLIRGFLEQYHAGGWVSRWSSPGYADLMVGTSSDVAFADAWLKGVPGFAPELAYEAALKNATVVPPGRHVGRKGMAHSTFRGYADTGVHEGMSWTLEGALNDFGIANMAQALSERATSPAERERYDEEAEYFRYRAGVYAHLFDRRVGFFQGRGADGDWRLDADAYDPRVWGHDYTEANGWTFAFTAPHDGEGLAALYGGRDALAAKLDTFFATPETADPAFVGSYGGVIHEMTEARDVRMGMYAHSNQPSHHIPWMYLYAGQPWKTQRIVRDILERLYLGSEIGQGYPGDEDNGEMSAWYLFAALGLYPLRMGAPEYVIGAPLFERATVALDDARTLEVRAINHSRDNVYVQSLTVNGRPWSRTWIPHDVIAAGATLEFTMGPEPSTWGSRPEDAPPSLTPVGRTPQTLADLIDETATVRVGDTSAPALVDDDATTDLWLRGDQAGVEIGLAQAGTPTFYTLTSGERTIRDAAWTLQGRNGDGPWRTLDTRGNEDFDWSRQTRPFRIASPGSYDTYRVRFTAPGRLQLAEIELLAPYTPGTPDTRAPSAPRTAASKETR